MAQREEMYDFLAGHGYRVHRIESESDYRGPVVGRGDLMNWQHFDIFCIPPREAE